MASTHNTAWYINYGDGATTGYYALPQWQQAAYGAGAIIRQMTTPILNGERAFIALNAGTTGGTEPLWSAALGTKGQQWSDGAVTWQECTGMAALNGDAVNTPAWSVCTPQLGDIVQDTAGTTFFICSTGGAGYSSGATEPTWNKATGEKTTDGTLVWTSVGAIAAQKKWGCPIPRVVNSFGLNQVTSIPASTTVTWGGPGDNFYIADNHRETQNAPSRISQFWGDPTKPVRIVCVNHAGNVPPQASDLATTAQIISPTYAIIEFHSAYVYWYGISLISNGYIGIGSPSSAIGTWFVWDTCEFYMTSNNGNDKFYVSSGTGAIWPTTCEMVNSSISFGTVDQFISVADMSRFVWRDSPNAIIGPIIPTSLFGFTQYGHKNSIITFDNIDIHQIVGPLVGHTYHSDQSLQVGLGNGCSTYFNNCRLNPNAIIAVSPMDVITYPFTPDERIYVSNSDSGPTNYRQELWQFAGQVKLDATPPATYRVSGATDGTTPISWQMGTNALAGQQFCLESFEMAAWNSTAGSQITVSVPITGPAGLNTGDVWLEVKYFNDPTSPITGTASSGLATVLTPNTTPLLTDGSSLWIKGLGHNYLLRVQCIPQMAGVIKAIVKVAKPSILINVDPKLQGVS